MFVGGNGAVDHDGLQCGFEQLRIVAIGRGYHCCELSQSRFCSLPLERDASKIVAGPDEKSPERFEDAFLEPVLQGVMHGRVIWKRVSAWKRIGKLIPLQP